MLQVFLSLSMLLLTFLSSSSVRTCQLDQQPSTLSRKAVLARLVQGKLSQIFIDSSEVAEGLWMLAGLLLRSCPLPQPHFLSFPFLPFLSSYNVSAINLLLRCLRQISLSLFRFRRLQRNEEFASRNRSDLCQKTQREPIDAGERWNAWKST